MKSLICCMLLAYMSQNIVEIFGTICKTNTDEKTLKLVSVIFRHGHRINEFNQVYPNYPYLNISFFPYSSGDLTKTGEVCMFKLGQTFRRRYDRFLGDRYYTDLINSLSSGFKRCQASLQNVHAGLFFTRKWNPVAGLPWQAIPYDMLPPKQDKFLATYFSSPTLLDRHIVPPAFEFNETLLDYVKKHSGYDKVTYFTLATILHSTLTDLSYGLPLPKWLKPIYPEPLISVAKSFLQYTIDHGKRQGIGFLLRKITEDALGKANGTLSPSTRKLFLYSGHDLNLYLIMGALNVWNHELVQFGAYLIFELHQIKNIFGFMIYYSNNYSQPELLVVPGCAKFCPLDEFIKLTHNVYDPVPICNENLDS